MAPAIVSRSDARAQGLTRYFTGDPCNCGHVCGRYVSNLTCVECDRAKQRRLWPLRDKEKSRAARRLWEKENREALRAKDRKLNARPGVKARKAAWFQANKERILEKRRASQELKRANVASAARWSKANPEKAREYSRLNQRKRRAQKHNSNGTHTPADLKEILVAQGNRCAYCRADLRRAKKHVDHIVPLARGGSNGRSNLQYLCQPCNQSKSARDPVAYARSIGLLL